MRRGARVAAVMCASLALTFSVCGAAAEETLPADETVLLWPEGAPDAVGDEERDKPALFVFRPEPGKANGSAVVVCPGGGYGHLAMGHEGQQIADWLTASGFTAFILRYRHGPCYLHPAPLEDADRALRVVRARADDWGIDPDRIGLMGFSAGGHLASTLGTHYAKGRVFKVDRLRRVSSRPDFLILIYPVISLIMPDSHRGSMHNLLGPEPDPALLEYLSNDRHVTRRTPPTFLVHTNEDTVVSAENSTLFYNALREAEVPAELHIYEQGPHGFGLAADDPSLSTWPGLCIEWLRRHGFASDPENGDS